MAIIVNRTFEEIKELSEKCNHNQAILAKIYTEHIEEESPDLSWLETKLDENGNIISSSRYTQEELDKNREEYEKCIKEDQKRLDSYGQTWNMLGIQAVAQIYIPFELLTMNGKVIHFLIQNLTSAGMWGIESDSSQEYFKEIEKKEVENLKRQLSILQVIQ